MMRLDKYLSFLGKGTRKEVKEFIKKGLVSVNGITIKNITLNLDILEITHSKYEN